MGWFAVLALFAFLLVLRLESREFESRAARTQALLSARSLAPSIAPMEDAAGYPPALVERVCRSLAEVSRESFEQNVDVDPRHLRLEDGLCDVLGYDLDSLAFIDLTVSLEREFRIRFPLDRRWEREPCVEDIVRLVAEGLRDAATEPHRPRSRRRVMCESSMPSFLRACKPGTR